MNALHYTVFHLQRCTFSINFCNIVHDFESNKNHFKMNQKSERERERESILLKIIPFAYSFFLSLNISRSQCVGILVAQQLVYYSIGHFLIFFSFYRVFAVVFVVVVFVYFNIQKKVLFFQVTPQLWLLLLYTQF